MPPIPQGRTLSWVDRSGVETPSRFPARPYSGIALSPDGKMVSFTAVGEDNTTYLYLRHLDRGEAVVLSGTEDAAYPFWSPDSDFIAFFTVINNKLRKIAISGGPPITLCAAGNGKGGRTGFV